MTEPARKRPRGRARTSLGVVGSLVVIALAIAYSYYVPRTWTMGGPSMEPALADGDSFVTVALAPRLGDIVVIETPAGATIVKRVVGMPDDIIEMRAGALVRNGRIVTGPGRDTRGGGRVCRRESVGAHVYDVAQDAAGFPDTHSPLRVPPHQVFVLGDQRDRSNDSRYFGSVPIRKVLGRLVRIISRATPTIVCPVSRTPR